MPSHRRTLFLPDIAAEVTQDELNNIFAPYGDIIEIKMKKDTEDEKYSAFIRYLDPKSAITAKSSLGSHTYAGGKKLRILWVNKPSPHDMGPKLDDLATAQVHVSFVSRQIENMVSELSLRKLFSTFGEVLTVEIKAAQMKEGLEVEQTQSGYGFVHYRGTPAGIESAQRAVTAFQRQTVDRVTYDCNLSHKLQSVLDAQKAKKEGYVEVDEVAYHESQGTVYVPPQRQPRQHHHTEHQHAQQQPQQQQSHQQFHKQQVQHQHHQHHQKADPGTPQPSESRFSGSTTSSSSGRNNFNASVSSRSTGSGHNRGGGGGNSGVSSGGMQINTGRVPSSVSEDYSISIPGSPYHISHQAQGMTYSGSSGGTTSATGGQYEETSRISSTSTDSFRSHASMDFIQSPSISNQHLMYRGSYPSPHHGGNYPHPPASAPNYTAYPPHEMYSPGHPTGPPQQGTPHMGQGAYMIPYNGPPQGPPQQGAYDDGRMHYVDTQQPPHSPFMYHHSPGMVYVPSDMMSSPNRYMIESQRVRQQQQNPQHYAHHMSPGAPYIVQGPLQQQPPGSSALHRSAMNYGYNQAPPYGSMNVANLNRQQGGANVGGGAGVSRGNQQQYAPRARLANSSLRTFDNAPQQIGYQSPNSPSNNNNSSSGGSSSKSTSPYPTSTSPIPSSTSGFPSASGTITLTTSTSTTSTVSMSSDMAGIVAVTERMEGMGINSSSNEDNLSTRTNTDGEDLENEKIGPG